MNEVQCSLLLNIAKNIGIAIKCLLILIEVDVTEQVVVCYEFASVSVVSSVTENESISLFSKINMIKDLSFSSKLLMHSTRRNVFSLPVFFFTP